MNRVIAAVCILVVSLLAFALTAVMIAGIMGYKVLDWGINNVSFVTGGNSVLLKEESLTLSEYGNLNIDAFAQSVRVRSASGDKLTVRHYGSSQLDSRDHFTMNASGDTVTIDSRDRNFRIHFMSWAREYIEVEIPSSWFGNVDMRTRSGGLTLEDSFEWRDVSLRCTSGGVIVNRNLKAEMIDISVSSGGITLRDTVESDNLNIKCTSGGIKTEALSAGTFDITTSSGGMRIGELTGKGEIRATSGGIRVLWLNPTGNVDIRVTSGGITVDVPSGLKHYVSTKATSGSVRVNER